LLNTFWKTKNLIKIEVADKMRKENKMSGETLRFTAQMLELLGRFELPTSSLPTDFDPRTTEPCCAIRKK